MWKAPHAIAASETAIGSYFTQRDFQNTPDGRFCIYEKIWCRHFVPYW